jgi:hypothetical protein
MWGENSRWISPAACVIDASSRDVEGKPRKLAKKKRHVANDFNVKDVRQKELLPETLKGSREN